ncbi:MAG: hypothetical protein AAB731_02080 [Patescibacteria group bacterium]
MPRRTAGCARCPRGELAACPAMVSDALAKYRRMQGEEAMSKITVEQLSELHE